MKIDDRFIKEAIRIREEYLLNVKDIKDKEGKIISIKDDINNAYEMAIKASDMDKELIESKIDRLRNDVNDITKYIQPIMKNINDLRNDADVLYENIKDKYPNITKDELIDIMAPYMKEIDNKFNFE